MNRILEKVAEFLNTNATLELFSPVYIGFLPLEEGICINIKDSETKACVNGGRISTINISVKIKNRDFSINQSNCNKLFTLFNEGRTLTISSDMSVLFIGCESVPIVRHDGGVVMGGLVAKFCISDGEWVNDD